MCVIVIMNSLGDISTNSLSEAFTLAGFTYISTITT